MKRELVKEEFNCKATKRGYNAIVQRRKENIAVMPVYTGVPGKNAFNVMLSSFNVPTACQSYQVYIHHISCLTCPVNAFQIRQANMVTEAMSTKGGTIYSPRGKWKRVSPW